MQLENGLLLSLDKSRLIGLLSGTSFTGRNRAPISHFTPVLSRSVLLLVDEPKSTRVAEYDCKDTIIIMSGALSPTGGMQRSTVVTLIAILLFNLALFLGLVDFLSST